MNANKFFQRVTDKWPAKVISLAAALIISTFYRLSTLETRVFTIPLQAEITSDFIPLDSLEHSVRVTLRGDAASILTISEEDIEAYIDLSKFAKEGTYRVPVQIRKIGNALGADPLEISVSPSVVQITLEEKASRFIPVYPSLSGNTSYGYEMAGQLFAPESVIASGPRSIIDGLTEFTTETINLDSRAQDFTILVPIINDNPRVTIHGSRLIEYTGFIRRIELSYLYSYLLPLEKDDNEDDEDEDAEEAEE